MVGTEFGHLVSLSGIKGKGSMPRYFLVGDPLEASALQPLST